LLPDPSRLIPAKVHRLIQHFTGDYCRLDIFTAIFGSTGTELDIFIQLPEADKYMQGFAEESETPAG